jgi:hypothetical protein
MLFARNQGEIGDIVERSVHNLPEKGGILVLKMFNFSVSVLFGV